MNYSKLKSSVNRKWLLVISGLMWSGVGIFQNILAFSWLNSLNNTQIFISVMIGLLAVLAIAYFGFGNITNKNVNRILANPKKACVFAFKEWKSYILITVMIIFGIFLKTMELIPKFILTPMYSGIGTALFFANFKYYRNLI